MRISALNLTLPVRRKCLGETSGPKPAGRGGSIRPCRPNGALFSHHSTNPCPRWKGGSHPPNTHECLQTCRNFLSLIGAASLPEIDPGCVSYSVMSSAVMRISRQSWSMTVSRWGRFQNCDEAAHYEFLCQNSGVRVYYCAELFINDGSILSD